MLYDCKVIRIKTKLDKAFDKMNEVTLQYCRNNVIKDLKKIEGTIRVRVLY